MLTILAIIAVWRITYTVQDFSGPLDIIKTVREWIESKQTKHKLLSFDCHVCLSTVIALPVAFYLANGWDIPLYWFAIAGGASIIHTIYERIDN